MIRFAEASFAALIMIRSSIRCWSTGIERGLDDEHVGAADRVLVAAVRLAVRERLERHLAELAAELLGDLAARARGSSGPRRASAACSASARSRAPTTGLDSRAHRALRAPEASAQPSRFPPRPSLIVCLGGNPTSALSGTSSVITVPAAVHTSSPIVTGATNIVSTATRDVLADHRPLLRHARAMIEVRGDRSRRRCSFLRRSRRRRCRRDAAPSRPRRGASS